MSKLTSDLFTIDDSLRDHANDPEALSQIVKELRSSLLQEKDATKRCELFGELGVALRVLEKPIEAEAALAASLKLVQSAKLGVRLETQQRIRFAHVLQWQRRFSEASALFDEVILACQEFPEAAPLLAFAHQHSGKNHFDQGKFKEALADFEKALALRLEQQAPADQIASSEHVIRIIKQKLANF